MRKLLTFLLFLACAGGAAAFDPTKTPVSPDGTKAVIDLPASQHMRNTGGSDGLGLCVFTSLQHAGYWQNIRTLDGFRAFMESQPGGGYPQKVDAMLAKFCKLKGVSVPPYIQHTGGDAEFLEAALKTDRIVCVTYAGQDDFYRGPIAHMVNLAHLDDTHAAIIDNNRPGYWVWMTRAQFLSRWRGMSGGWAVVFLASPPPSYPEGAQIAECHCKPAPGGKGTCGGFDCPANGGKGPCACVKGCICGDDCHCKPGDCPKKCPVLFGQCSGGNCPLSGGCSGGGCRLQPATAPDGIYRGAEPPASPAPSAEHEWRPLDDGSGYGWRLKDKEKDTLTGVVPEKIHTHPEYSISGIEVTRAQAHKALAGGSGGSLTDDSDRWHVAAVGDVAFQKQFLADVASLPVTVRGKLLVQAYDSDRWEVAQFKLVAGVTLRKPSPVRTSATVGTVAASDYSAAKLTALLATEGGPTYVKPAPVAPPAPTPDWPTPAKPAPDNGGGINPPANPPSRDLSGWLAALVLGAVLLINKLLPKKS